MIERCTCGQCLDSLELLKDARDILTRLAMALVIDHRENLAKRYPQCASIGAQLTAAINEMEGGGQA